MVRSSETTDIAIVGGGICGLTTALALEQRGVSSRVYEAASEYRPVGAGILLQTNALLVFDRLGIAERVRSAGVPLADTRIVSPTGRVLQRFDLDGVERTHFDYGYVAIHRGALQRILLDELDTDVRTGTACVAVEDPARPTVRFEDGTRIRPDVVVGADGIDSNVRDAVAPRTDVRTLDATVYRAIVDREPSSSQHRRGLEVWGHGTYTGGAPIDETRFYWFATAPTRMDGSAVDAQRLRDAYRGFPEPIPDVVDAIDSSDLITTSLTDVPPLDRWSRGAVVLAGDAAHGMLPFAGQGAAQAVEDALAVAAALTTHADHATAFETYARARKRRADRIRAESRWLGALATTQSRLRSRARNRAAGVLPDRLFRRLRRRRIAGTSLPETDSLG